MKDFELNMEHFKSIWTFYQIYRICLCVLGRTDNQIKKKDKLILLLIINPNDLNTLNKLKDYIAQDNFIIELALNSIKEIEDVEEIYEDFYPVNIVGVNLNDRGK